MNKILIFTPYLAYSGSELVLFNYIASVHQTFSFDIVTFNKGALVEKLPSNIKCITIEKNPIGITKIFDFIYRILTKKRWYERSIIKLQRKKQYQLWYINTLALPEIVQLAEKNNIKTILHTHELFQAISNYSTAEIECITQYPNYVICCSTAAKKLFDIYKREKNISIVNPPLLQHPTQKINLLEKCSIPTKKTKIWGMAGRMDTNKNPFLFIEICELLINQDDTFHFIWFGGNPNSTIYQYCVKLIHQKKLTNHISLINTQPEDLINYMTGLSGIVLTSFYESFSLIALEGMSLNLPVVSHNNGGIIDVLGIDYDYVPAYTANKYANMIIQLETIPEYRTKLIELGKSRIKFFNSKDKNEQITQIINNIL